MARTDALAVEGLDAAIDRAVRLRRGRRRHDLSRGDDRPRDVPAVRRRGEACRSSPTSRSSARRRSSPLDELRSRRRRHRRSIRCSAFRAMNAAALKVYQTHPPRRHAEERRADDADARRALRLSRLSRLRAEARRSCSRKRDERRPTTPSTTTRMTIVDVARPKPKKSVALSGVAAGNTALCTVGRTGNDLHYRGYDILDIADACEFEEIAYLLVHGKLPNARRARRLQGASSSRCAACPRRVQGGARAAARRRASDGRDAHRRVGARRGAAGEATTTTCPARATSPTG